MSKGLSFFVEQMHYRSINCATALNTLIEARKLNKDVLKYEQIYNAELTKLKHYAYIVVELENIEETVRNKK